MAFVLDCSVALTWILPDEDGDQISVLSEALTSESAVVPEIWPLEVANALLVARRHRRLKDKDVERAVRDLAALPIEIDRETHRMALKTIMALANKYKLSSYDAAYLELAQRQSLPLATLDRKLRSACKTAGIVLL